MIENRTWLHPGQLFVRVDLDDVVHVFGHVDHDSSVTALSGQAGTTAACKNRRAKAAARRYSLDHILYASG